MIVLIVAMGLRKSEAMAEAKRRGLDMRRAYERHDCQCSCPGTGCAKCGYTGMRRRTEFVPADKYGPNGPGTRSSRRYGQYLQIRDAHTELTFREYLRHFAGKDGRA